MQLTRRQCSFLEKLFDVYYSHCRQPVHYSDLAHALGVSNSTAYQVLRSLEQQGYISSEYRLADHHAGPGRSMVLFRPTIKALRRFRNLLGEDVRHKDWDVVKKAVLERLAVEGLPDGERLLTDLLGAIGEDEDPLTYCGHVLAASLVSIRRQWWGKLQELSVFRNMAGEDAAGLATIGLLPGFALGLSFASPPILSWQSRLAECVTTYQGYWRQMDEEARLLLLGFSREAIKALRFSSDL